MRYDCVIIGGGISGLSAARALRMAGRSCVVLEARDRVGGRTLSTPLGTDVVDLGGQWIGPTQPRVHRLIDELGLQTFPQFHEGKKIMHLDGEKRAYTGTIPSLPIWALLELQYNIKRLEKMASRIDPAMPWHHPGAKKLDSMTVARWLDDHIRSAGAKFSLETAVRAILVCEPAEVSFFYFLFYIRCAGGLMPLVEIPGGAQQDRIVGGAQQISLRLAAETEVRIDHRVRKIGWGDGGVAIHTDDGVLESQRCIVALSPSLVSKIDFAPALPRERIRLQQRMPMGSVIKCIATYDAPFWRDAGFSGEAICDHGPTRFIFDDSPADASQGALVGFIAGDDARVMGALTPPARKTQVLTQWATLFSKRAANPNHYVDHDWNQETWSRGCYVGLMGPETMTSLGTQLRAPVGPIHWAGTETATEWVGYFEGAIEAGERAAAAVHASL